MDVRCERCRAQYVFDDEQVTPAGLTVQCTNCGHLFKVKKKELVVTVPVKPEELEGTPLPASAAAPRPHAPAAPSSPAPAAPAAPEAERPREPPREWRVRQANGNIFTFRELTTLQKWIIEQKVSRDDEISLAGDQWKRLGNIAELASFFQVVEAAERGKGLPAGPAVTPLPMPVPVYGVAVQTPALYPPPPSGFPPPSYAVTPAPLPQMPYAVTPAPAPLPHAQYAVTPVPAPLPQPPYAVTPAPAPLPPPRPEPRRAPAPAPTVDVDLGPEELASVGRGRGGRVAIAALAVAVAGAAWFLAPELFGRAPPPAPPAPSAPPTAESSPPPAPAPPPATAPAPGPAAESVAVPITIEVKPAADPPAAPPAEHPPSPPPAPVAAPEPVAEASAAPPPRAIAKAPAVAPAPKGPKAMLAQAAKLREKGNVERALDLYGRVADADPSNVEALTGRGLCYLDLERYPPAEASFEAALAAAPDAPGALLGLAETYRWQGKNADAIRYYERYLAKHPGGEEADVARNALEELRK